MDKFITITPAQQEEETPKLKFTVTSDMKNSFSKHLNVNKGQGLFEYRFKKNTKEMDNHIIKNKVSYYRKDTNASEHTPGGLSTRRNSISNSRLEARGNLNRKYKKLKSPTQDQSNLKRLEKAFRAIANSSTVDLAGQAQNINNVTIKLTDLK